MRMIQMIGLAVGLIVAPVPIPAMAQDVSASAANEIAQERGNLLYLYDQAAWHGTDALAEEINFGDHPELRGYLVEPSSNESGHLDLVFYAEDDDGFYEFARYEVDVSEVVGGGVLQSESKARLSSKLVRMAEARSTAADYFVAQDGWGLCTREAANTVVLPPDEAGVITVYLLTATKEANLYPFGGHFRVDIAASGSAEGGRKFTNACLNMPISRNSEGQMPVGIAVSHSLDNHPTEIHYFQSHYIPAKVFVLLDGDAWIIDKGEFEELKSDFGK